MSFRGKLHIALTSIIGLLLAAWWVISHYPNVIRISWRKRLMFNSVFKELVLFKKNREKDFSFISVNFHFWYDIISEKGFPFHRFIFFVNAFLLEVI